MLPLLIIFAFPERPVVEIAITQESRLLQSELTRAWTPRRPEDAALCLEWSRRRAPILWAWDLRFIDQYDPEHPGYTAIRMFRTQRWRRLPNDYWLFDTAPIQWMDYELRLYQDGLTQGSEWSWSWWDTEDFRTSSTIQMPWVPGHPHTPHIPATLPEFEYE